MQDPSQRRPGDRIIRRPRVRPVQIDVSLKRPPRQRPLSPLVLAYGFAVLIGLGTLLLFLPAANNHGGFTPAMTAFFTATSAATVNGLTVADSATHWSPFGKAVIIVLLQVGGLGFMMASALLFIILGRRISLRGRLAIREAAGATSVGGVVQLAKRVGLLVLVVEGLGFVAFAIRFSFDFPMPLALWHSLFHSISAFNNAGFVVLPGEGLGAYRSDASVMVITASMFIVGGLNIAIISDIAARRTFNRFTLDTKLVLSATAFLTVVGLVIVLLTEYSNPDTLGGMGIPGKLLSSFFESASARTAGFSGLSPGAFTQSALFFVMGLMFIGGAAGSTAGGIKVNTFAVIVTSAIATIRGRPRVEAFKREIPDYQVSRAVTLGVASVAYTLTTLLVLTKLEDARFIELLLETISAWGAGYSTGLPAELTKPGQFLLAITMFVGRIGPLTLILALSRAPEAGRYRFAKERINIG